MAKVDITTMMVAMAKAILEAAGEVDTAAEDAVMPAPEKKQAPEAEKPVKKAQRADTGEEKDDLEAKTTKELYQMCVDAGLKVPKYGKNKQFYIEQLTGADTADEDVEDGDAEEEDTEDAYAGKTAKELFELCKKRKIKVAPKKKAEHYAELLRKADEAAANAKAADDDDDGDWGDEEEEEAPAAPAKKGKKAPAKKKAEKPAPADGEEDDDDDWDI